MYSAVPLTVVAPFSVVAQRAIGCDAKCFVEFRAATVVLEDVVHLGLAVVTSLDNLFAGLLAVVDQNHVTRGLFRLYRARENAGYNQHQQFFVLHDRTPRMDAGRPMTPPLDVSF